MIKLLPILLLILAGCDCKTQTNIDSEKLNNCLRNTYNGVCLNGYNRCYITYNGKQKAIYCIIREFMLWNL